MSIYINNRILNIRELNEQLILLNKNIQSSLDCIKKAQEDYIHLHNQYTHQEVLQYLQISIYK